jgi:hypothetical protein
MTKDYKRNVIPSVVEESLRISDVSREIPRQARDDIQSHFPLRRGIKGNIFSWLVAKVFIFVISGILFLPTISNGAIPFKEGEILTYHFYWGIFMVGRGTFEVKREEKTRNYIFDLRVKSNDFISSIYPVDSIYTSFFHPKKLRSVRFLQDRKEGTSRYWEDTFFYDAMTLASTQSYISGETKWFEIPKAGVQDKLSTVYYMRTLNWDDRESAKIVIGNDKKNYEVEMKKVLREILSTDDFKDIPTFVVEPNMEYMSGYVKKGKMTVWVSDDTFKVPIRVISKLPVGAIRAELVRVEGIQDWPYDK